MIKQLKPFPAEPPPPRKPLPLCEATTQAPGLHEQQWRRQRYAGRADPMKCSRESVVEIDGGHYCRLHGGHKVLDMYLKGELIRLRRARDLPREPDGSPPTIVMVPGSLRESRCGCQKPLWSTDGRGRRQCTLCSGR